LINPAALHAAGSGNLPLRYASLFKFDLLIYLVIPAALLVWWLLYRTRWGLGVRAVGENPETAYASGRSPGTLKYQAVFVGGLLAGAGRGSPGDRLHHELGRVRPAGGFIAVALVIFSKWHPIRAIAVCWF
jgi:simple sugar transport system permease protein